MRYLKIFVVICCFSFIDGKRLIEIKNHHENVLNFVKNLMTDLNSQNSAKTDVVLLRLGVYKNTKRTVDDIYESLIDALPKENALMTPQLNKIQIGRDMKKAGVIVIVSDVYDAVSGFCLVI
jgi:hypothetical protein